MLQIQDLFNEQYYLRQNPDVQSAISRREFSSGLDHYLRVGQFQDRAPSALFDPVFYRSLYSDVDTAISQGGMTAIQHFINFGQNEGRDPISAFDTAYYLKQNADVNREVQNKSFNAYEHFVRFGRFETFRNPNSWFNTNNYLGLNSDIANAVTSGATTAIEHYIQYGKWENRQVQQPGVDKLLSTATNLGVIQGTQTREGTLGKADPVDIYSFILNNPSKLQINLGGLSNDADIELIQDVNKNGLVDNYQDILATSVNFEKTPDNIVVDSLAPGNYYIKVVQVPFSNVAAFGGNSYASFNPSPADTPYKLTVST
jgi:hypothetical protein